MACSARATALSVPSGCDRGHIVNKTECIISAQRPDQKYPLTTVLAKVSGLTGRQGPEPTLR